MIARSRRVLLLLVAIIGGLTVLVQATTPYTTTFPLTENPISEGGAWHNTDATTTKVRTELLSGVHVAHGTQVGGAFDDSSAYLAGFGIDQFAQATVWKSGSIASTPNMEVELLLDWADDYPLRSTTFGSTSADGYEINANQNGDYLNIGRFKSPAALNTITLSSAIGRAPATGDLFSAQVKRTNGTATVTVFWNGVSVLTATDTSPPLRGNPGIAFYIDAGGNNAQYGFSSATAGDWPKRFRAFHIGLLGVWRGDEARW